MNYLQVIVNYYLSPYCHPWTLNMVTSGAEELILHSASYVQQFLEITSRGLHLLLLTTRSRVFQRILNNGSGVPFRSSTVCGLRLQRRNGLEKNTSQKVFDSLRGITQSVSFCF